MNQKTIVILGLAAAVGVFLLMRNRQSPTQSSQFQQWQQMNPPPPRNSAQWDVWADRALQALNILFPDGVRLTRRDLETSTGGGTTPPGTIWI